MGERLETKNNGGVMEGAHIAEPRRGNECTLMRLNDPDRSFDIKMWAGGWRRHRRPLGTSWQARAG